MNDYRLHELSGDAFEGLVIHLCREVLGTGIVNFSEGRDGGRDGLFAGTANKYPSSRQPWSGKFVVQAKRTNNPVASCSNKEFRRVLDKELPKVKALKSEGEVDIYLVFTNRKLTGEADASLRRHIAAETGIEKNGVLGTEVITSYLDAHPTVVRTCGLDRFRGPLIIRPQEMAEVIEAFRQHPEAIDQLDGSKFEFDYTELETKNRLNDLSENFFGYIQENSEPYFADIHRFLKNPVNESYAEAYYTVADEFKAKITARRSQFDTFDDILNNLYDEIVRLVPSLEKRRRLVNVFLHFMYCNCDIGRRR